MIVDPHQTEAIVADRLRIVQRWRAGSSTALAGLGLPPMGSAARPFIAAIACTVPGTSAGRSAGVPPTARQLNRKPTRYDDSPQPVADLGRPAHGIHDFACNPIPPDQVTAGRFRMQGTIVGCGRDNLL